MLTLTAIRYADPADLPLIEEIERVADGRFAEVSRARGIDPGDFPGIGMPATERLRAGQILVAGQPAVGFAHVVEIAGHALLEQLSVLPEMGGHGIGTSLLRAAMGVALDRGHDRLHLRTFADVAWNGPYYSHNGFVEIADPSWVAPLLAAEEDEGLGRWGRRITMARALVDTPVPIPAVSVIPVRDGPEGIEAFVQHRVATMDFAPGVLVFPGGRVDERDHAAGARLALPEPLVAGHAAGWADTAYGMVGGDGQAAARTLLATGIREVAEETGARIDPARLIPWDDWITPIGVPKRFDVRFFLYPVEAAEAAAFEHATTEAHRSEWTALSDVVCRTNAREIDLLPPTRTLVDELAALGGVTAARILRPRISVVRHDIAGRRPRQRGGAAATVDG
ncbi:MAG: GNAT family N-acetyltransferase [Tetrasphaera sp.]|nr:GNAT family N-acetyltransferase [Tetrasphaera sp.]